MKNLKLLFLVITSFCFNLSFAQSSSSCPNSDFESGNFSGWSGKTGNCCPINVAPSGIISGRHTIMTGTGTDPNVDPAFPISVVAPGGLYSCRLGNDSSGSQAESLSYNITVTPSSTLFIYKYAIVLEDPGHGLADQPRFEVKVKDAAGNLIDPTCGQYTVAASSSIPGFRNYRGVVFKDWTTVGLNLTAYMGQTLTIEFRTGDCSLGAHFGYAYIDAYCSPLTISSTYCIGSIAATLLAPIGFTYLWSTGETTQSINVNNPTVGQTFSCTLTSPTGCVVTISTVLAIFVPTATFTMANTCYNNAVFTDTTYTPPNITLSNYVWDFGDGTTSNIQNPTHQYTGSGTYNVTLSVSNPQGCASTSVPVPVTLYVPPTAAISYVGSPYCTSLPANQAVTLTGTGVYTGGVFSSTTGLTINAATGSINLLSSTPGTYTVSYDVPSFNGCKIAPVTTSVTITKVPTATITYPLASYCNSITNPINISLSGTGAYTGGSYSVSPSTGLTLNLTTGAIIPSSSSGGNYVVTYTIPAIGGCAAIPVTTNINIYPLPTATISYGGTPYCTTMPANQAITLTGTYAYAGGVFTSSPAGLVINSSTGMVNILTSTPGTYTVTYTIPPASNCVIQTATTSITITKLPTVAISYSSSVYCKSVLGNVSVNLIGTSAYLGGIYTASPSGLTLNSTTGDITPTTSSPNNYVVTYTAPASTGCAAVSTSTPVRINPLPNASSLTDGTICVNQAGNTFRTVTLNTGLSNSSYSCLWTFNGTPIAGNTTNTLIANQAGTYAVVVTNNTTGCFTDPILSVITKSISIDNFTTVLTDVFSNNTTATVYLNGGTGPFSYQIDSEGFQDSNVFNNVSPGTHTITVIDDSSCTFVTKTITVFSYDKFFTPNGDGINDTWNLNYVNQKDATVNIYDKMGKLVKSFRPNYQFWDGKLDGNDLPSDDYWFVVNYKETNPQGELVWAEFRSHFSIKR